MKRPWILLFLTLGICHSILYAESLSLSVSAESAILMNADTGVILYEKNSHVERYPASITKVATALYALKVQGHALDHSVAAEHESIATITDEARRRSNYTLPPFWLTTDGTHIGIKKGEVLSLKDLIYGMMLASGNDAANVIAQHVGGTIPAFVEEMNLHLKEIGCTKTTFYNPHGLHHPKHKTTAFEMAMITREALKYPLFREIVKTVRYTRPKTNKQDASTLVQSNKLLRTGKLFYPKAIGVKTGYHSDAGHTFVAAATHEGRTLIAVLMKTKEREDIFKDSKKMFETAFSQTPVQRVLLKKGPQKFALNLDGAAKAVQSYVKNDVCIDYFPAEEPKIKCTLFWDKITPPITKDQRIGELRLTTVEGRQLQAIPLFALADVKETWGYMFSNLFSSKSNDVVEVKPSVSATVVPSAPPATSSRFWKGAGLLLAVLLLSFFLFRLRK